MNSLTKEQQNQEDLYSFPYHYLDLGSEEYRLLRRIEGIAKIRLIKDFILKNKFKKILDVGCGDARLFYEIKSFNGKLVGVDYSDQAIRFAKAFNPHAEFHCQRLEDLSIDGRYDCILLIDILEHIVQKNIPNVLTALHRILSVDGTLVVDVPTIKTPLEPKHYQHFSVKSLRSALEPLFVIEKIFGRNKAGFKRKIFNISRELGYFLYPLNGRLRLTWFYDFLSNFYHKHLITGMPEGCYNMVAFCKKEPAGTSKPI